MVAVFTFFLECHGNQVAGYQLRESTPAFGSSFSHNLYMRLEPMLHGPTPTTNKNILFILLHRVIIYLYPSCNQPLFITTITNMASTFSKPTMSSANLDALISIKVNLNPKGIFRRHC